MVAVFQTNSLLNAMLEDRLLQMMNKRNDFKVVQLEGLIRFLVMCHHWHVVSKLDLLCMLLVQVCIGLDLNLDILYFMLFSFSIFFLADFSC